MTYVTFPIILRDDEEMTLIFQYYAKALASPLGQKVKAFYTTTSKQILDIHDEARRIADDQKANTATSEPAPAPVPVAKTD